MPAGARPTSAAARGSDAAGALGPATTERRLRRARAEAEHLGIHWIEFAEADVETLPFEARSFDLVVTYTGLHYFPNPPTPGW